MSAITTHVLDLSKGHPARGVAVKLEFHAAGGWRELADRVTDGDGRVRDLVEAGRKVEVGRYRLTFGTGDYFQSSGESCFYPEVQVLFELSDASAHYHVPLLLSPFGYSTYRGS